MTVANALRHPTSLKTPLALTSLGDCPRVSVLIANYNYGEHVANAIDSVLGQTYTNLEVIVCDDGSTDRSAEIVEEYEERDPRVTLLRKQNGGQASAWNAAYAASTGDIICTLDSDDAFFREKIASIVEYFTAHADCGFLVHSMIVLDGHGREVQQIPFMTKFETGWIADRVVRRGGRWRYMPASALGIRRDVAAYIFPIPEGLRVCADAFVFTMAPLITGIGCLPEPMAYYRIHGENGMSALACDLESVRKVAAWTMRVVDGVNVRLSELSLNHRKLNPNHDLKVLENQFTIHLLGGTRRAELIREYRTLLRALVIDDLYSVPQKMLGGLVYGGSIPLPLAARSRWLARTVGVSRCKRMVQTFAETARSVLRRLRREVVRLRRQSISHGHAPSISLFLPSLAGGGAERITLALAEGFVHRGFQVDLVLAVAQGPYLAQVPPGVRVVNLAARNVMAKLVALTGYLRRERPSVLLSSLDNVNIATCAKHLARASTRVILGVHNTVSRDLAGQRGFIGRLKPVLLRLMYPRADGIVAVSQGVARDLTATARLPSTRVHVIYNPVVTADLLDRAEEPLGHPWFGPGEPPVVLAVGRLTPQKDFSTLIRAFAQARQQHAARLVILGEGEEHSALETLARDLKVADHIAFCGFVANPYAWMARSAMLVLSSRWEGLPTVLIEALAVGIPVVSTDCESGPREILDNGRFGALVPVAHPTALADAIVETLRTVPDRTLLQERSREFGVEHSLDCYLDVFQSPLRRG